LFFTDRAHLPDRHQNENIGTGEPLSEIIRFMVLLVSSGYSPSDDQKIARDAMRRGWAGQE